MPEPQPTAPPNHDLTTRRCWCKPDLYFFCHECTPGAPTCWRCGGKGQIHIDDIPESEFEERLTEPVIVVHNDGQLPEQEEGDD